MTLAEPPKESGAMFYVLDEKQTNEYNQNFGCPTQNVSMKEKGTHESITIRSQTLREM